MMSLGSRGLDKLKRALSSITSKKSAQVFMVQWTPEVGYVCALSTLLKPDRPSVYSIQSFQPHMESNGFSATVNNGVTSPTGGHSSHLIAQSQDPVHSP